MNLGALIGQARAMLDDGVFPYKWDDLELIAYANEAVREAARRAPLMRDTLTVAVTAGVGRYQLHPSILRVLSAWLEDDNGNPRRVLTQKARWQTDRDMGACRGAAPGQSTGGAADTPQEFFNPGDCGCQIGVPVIFYIAGATISLSPIPFRDGTLKLDVTRLPLQDMQGLPDTPEIPEMYHDALVYRMLSRAYQKQDIETASPEKQQLYESLFTEAFGRKLSAVTEINLKQNPMDMRMVNRGFGF